MIGPDRGIFWGTRFIDNLSCLMECKNLASGYYSLSMDCLLKSLKSMGTSTKTVLAGSPSCSKKLAYKRADRN